MRVSLYKELCILAALVAAVPAYAEETSSVPIGTNGRPMVRTEQRININVADELKKRDVSLSDSESPALSSDVTSVLGKSPATVEIWGSKLVPTEMFLNDLSVKAGSPLRDEDILKDLRMIYMSGFYKDVRFNYAICEDGSLKAVYQVFENPALQGIDVQGTVLFNNQQLAGALGLQQGSMVNMKTVGESLSALTKQAKDAGYSLFTLRSMSLSDDGILHLGFYDGIVDGFEIQGNSITKPEVIMREIRQDMEKPLNTFQLQRSGQRLNNLGLFDGVDFQLIPSPNNPDHVKVLIVVEEANNATIGLGVGYSETDHTTGQFTIGDKNFLGKGDDIQFKWEFGGETKRNYDISYTRPYLDRKGTSFSINLYDGIHESAEYDHGGNEIARFDKRALGQEITFSRADSEYTRNSIRIKNRKDEYDGAVSGYSRQYFEDSYDSEYYQRYGKVTTAAERRKEDFGTTRSITLARVYDSRDNFYEPHKGKRNEIAFEWAGFGGDFNFRKLSLDQRYYWSAGTKGKHTVAFDLAAGYAWGDMPLSQRFSVGGPSTLRGYEDGQFRGNSMLRASLEYRVPVAKRVSLLGFIDSGYAWDKRVEDNFDLSKIKVGYGVGVRLQTPIGPVKLDYGFGKRDDDGSYKGKFHFSFGGSF